MVKYNEQKSKYIIIAIMIKFWFIWIFFDKIFDKYKDVKNIYELKKCNIELK